MRSLFVAIMLLIASVANAQTGPCPTADPGFQVNPGKACFRANVAEHTGVDPVTNIPIISRYDMLFFAESVDVTTGNPVQTSAIGKPPIVDTPTGTVWYGTGTSTPLPSYPLGQRFKSVIVAVGPGGTSARVVAATSNPFGRSNPPTAPSAPSSHRLMPD